MQKVYCFLIFRFIFNTKRLNFNIFTKRPNRKPVPFSRIVAKFFPQISNKKIHPFRKLEKKYRNVARTLRYFSVNMMNLNSYSLNSFFASAMEASSLLITSSICS